MKTHFKQNLKIVILGMLLVVLLTVAVLEFLPTEESGIKVKEKIMVSSSVISVLEGNYASYLEGLLFNPTDETLKISDVSITVSDGKQERTVNLPGFELSPRCDYKLSAQWEGMVEYNSVKAIWITVDGVPMVLKNTESTFTFSALAVLASFFFVVILLMLVHACRVRYYQAQEDALRRN